MHVIPTLDLTGFNICSSGEAISISLALSGKGIMQTCQVFRLAHSLPLSPQLSSEQNVLNMLKYR
jgi:hypothetical protein